MSDPTESNRQSSAADIALAHVHRELTAQFERFGHKWITRWMPVDKMGLWALKTEQRLRLSHGTLHEPISEFYWACSDAQIAFGFTLWSHKFCKTQRGAQGTAYREPDIPDLMGLGEVYYWHHYAYAYECLYRAWERLAAMLVATCYPDTRERLYFGGVVDKLRSDPCHSANPQMGALVKQVKHWSAVASQRNQLSHKRSAHFRHFHVETTQSQIIGPNNEPLFRHDYSYPDLLQAIRTLAADNERLLPAVDTIKGVIDNVPSGKQ